MSAKPIAWFDDFLGVGYRYHEVHMNVFPVFNDKMFAFKLWMKTVNAWPDDQIKLRFVEHNDNYWFVLYDASQYRNGVAGFVKLVPRSDNYERFKAGYEKKAILRFGIYKESKKKGGSGFNLEVLKKSKSVYDIAFLQYSDVSPESTEWQGIQETKHDAPKV